uniref:Uncharacterized protein n=1 Tax=Arundo donax TaxID=35708 RepID=A0A0A9DRM9_ARUDO
MCSVYPLAFKQFVSESHKRIFTAIVQNILK